MSTKLAAPRVSPFRPLVDDDQRRPSPDLATARYVDREIAHARATAQLCTAVAERARSQGRNLIAGVLFELATELIDEAALLAPAALPTVRWPGLALWHANAEAGLDESIDDINDSLQDSERTLRWIARRPDLPSLAAVTFDALASARRAQRRLLLACAAIDS